MAKDLTKGSPFKLILTFAIPFMMVNIFQQIYNIADTLIVGRILGTSAMTAVASTGTLMWFTISAPTSLALGFSMLTAQFVGAKDEYSIKRSFSNGLVLSLLFTGIMSMLGIIFLEDILQLFKFPKEIFASTYKYFIWIMYGLVPNTIFYFNSSMMRALGDSKTPMVFSVFSCIINIILDYLIISKTNLGTGGAGLATFIAQVVTCIMSSIYLYKNFPILHFPKNYLLPDKKIVKSLIVMGVPVALFDIINASGGVIGQYAVNTMEMHIVTAVAAASKVINLLNTPLFAIGSAFGVYVAQNYGAKEYGRIKQGARSTGIILVGWNLIMILVSLLFSNTIISFIANTTDAETIKYATIYMNINNILYIIVDFILVYRSVLIACGKNVAPVISGVGELLGRSFGTFVLTSLFGFWGVVLIGPVAWVLGMIINMVGYFVFMSKLSKENVQ